MSKSVHAPYPVKQPNLTRKFPLSDMPTGLMAALVTRLADHLLIRSGCSAIIVRTPIQAGHGERPEWTPRGAQDQTALSSRPAVRSAVGSGVRRCQIERSVRQG
jgi:hypothetical protein